MWMKASIDDEIVIVGVPYTVCEESSLRQLSSLFYGNPSNPMQYYSINAQFAIVVAIKHINDYSPFLWFYSHKSHHKREYNPRDM